MAPDRYWHGNFEATYGAKAHAPCFPLHSNRSRRMRSGGFSGHAAPRLVRTAGPGRLGPAERRPPLSILRTCAALILALAFAGAAAAQEAALSDNDRAAIPDIIGKQIEAFRRDDGDAAFGLASPTIQGMFGNADVFMDMVRQGYRPVYRPRAFDFSEIVELDGQPTQKVNVIGPDGRPVTAFYPMTRLPDGSWRIDGCFLKAPDEPQA